MSYSDAKSKSTSTIQELQTPARYNATMRVTLFGASGLLGQEIVKELSGGEPLTALSSIDADLRDWEKSSDHVPVLATFEV